MTHLPPLPDAASTPYPLHPAPIPEAQKQATRAAEEAAERQREADERQKRATKMIGIGLGSTLLVGATAVGLRLYSRRTQPASAGSRKRRGADDRNNRGAQDRARVASGQPYEVSYFARKHGLTAAEARAILKESGTSRDAANKLAAARKAKA